jgi:hypothetical protein
MGWGKKVFNFAYARFYRMGTDEENDAIGHYMPTFYHLTSTGRCASSTRVVDGRGLHLPPCQHHDQDECSPGHGFQCHPEFACLECYPTPRRVAAFAPTGFTTRYRQERLADM